MGNRLNTLATEAAAQVTGKRYCISHSGEALLTDGSFVIKGNGNKQWICYRCQERIKRPIAKNK